MIFGGKIVRRGMMQIVFSWFSMSDARERGFSGFNVIHKVANILMMAKFSDDRHDPKLFFNSLNKHDTPSKSPVSFVSLPFL